MTDFRYQGRIAESQEFGWLLSDVEEFNLNKDKKDISLLESARRKEMEDGEAKRDARKAARKEKGPLLGEYDTLADAGDPIEVTVDEDEQDTDEDEDERPDLLLRESARIVRHDRAC